MVHLAIITAVPALALAGLVWCFTAAWYRNRLIDANELADAARDDATNLAMALRGLQESLAAGFPIDRAELAPPRMPRTEKYLLDAAAREVGARRFRKFNRAHRGADLPQS